MRVSLKHNIYMYAYLILYSTQLSDLDPMLLFCDFIRSGAASSKPIFISTDTPHVPLTFHMGLLRFGLFEATVRSGFLAKAWFIALRWASAGTALMAFVCAER